VAKTRPAETPLMRQFLDIKERHPDAIVLFRLGDFYEMFFEDAVLAARVLSLTLTTRDKGKADAVPMCGVPHHASRGYIAKLTAAGHRVVIAEQTEDARQAKGLVRREVVRVVTPGVILDDDVLEPRAAHFVAAATTDGDVVGLAYLDVTTGEFRATETASVGAALDELARIGARELLVTAADVGARGALAQARRRSQTTWTTVPALDDKGAAARLAAVAIAGACGPVARRAAAMALGYAQATQPIGVVPVRELAAYQTADSVLLDESAVANLELVQTIIGGHRRGSLLDVIDDTRTAPGARCLRRWLLYPLTDVAEIRRRQDAVAALVDGGAARAELRELLGGIADLERLAGKASLAVATPRDLGRLRDSLLALPALATRLGAIAGKRPGPDALLGATGVAPAALATLARTLAGALVDEPPIALKDGGVIRTGHDEVVDQSRRLTDGGKEELAALEERERAASGIASLKIRFNRVFGYYVEVSRGQVGKVPAHFVRKQTIAGGERYVTPALADLERRVLAAEETLATREAELFAALVAQVAAEAHAIATVGRRLAAIDACQGLAEVAQRRGYVRPTVDDSLRLEIVGGRHPVVEAMLGAGEFVPNDCRLDGGAADGRTLLLVTGPNMAGKSTYMRQVAQLVLLAQLGAFVPATSAHVGVCDRIFTRVGAADNLARGDSTFMVEMKETAAILAGATARSLVILDEVGRGTSTFDGVSIAWAIAEHLHDVTSARGLFATHYHELVALAHSRPRIHNVSAAVAEQGGEVVFLRRIVDGAASRSYGIDVARLAGLPRGVVARARQVLARLESGAAHGGGESAGAQLSLIATAPPGPAPVAPPVDPLRARLAALDVNQLTPLAALALLAELSAAATK
jgi:DNA mismatch repair protein MutS